MANKKVETETAAKLADLTFKLLANCQEKEARLADKYGLTQSEFRCLRLFNKKDVLNNKQVAERMNLSPSRLTRIIDGLVVKDYIIRQIEPSDRRNMKVELSKRGKVLVTKLNDAYVNIHREILEDIDKPQHKPLINAMENLLGALQKWITRT
jgi:DNA-binding MarR family transcriptional regulator